MSDRLHLIRRSSLKAEIRTKHHARQVQSLAEFAFGDVFFARLPGRASGLGNEAVRPAIVFRERLEDGLPRLIAERERVDTRGRLFQ